MILHARARSSSLSTILSYIVSFFSLANPTPYEQVSHEHAYAHSSGQSSSSPREREKKGGNMSGGGNECTIEIPSNVVHRGSSFFARALLQLLLSLLSFIPFLFFFFVSRATLSPNTSPILALLAPYRSPPSETFLIAKPKRTRDKHRKIYSVSSCDLFSTPTFSRHTD
jgi:hypothetical protein